MPLDRAYSLLEVKAIDEEKRILTGIATTPTPDRIGDIVVPEGAEFKLPIPLLWHHMSSQPIGEVTRAKVTSKGIEIEAKIASIDEPGNLKNRLDEAWQAIKIGLVKGLSIGFKAIEKIEIEGTWNYRFVKWLWLELSAVTIPANAEATINTVKAIDTEELAALGQKTSSDIIVRLISLPSAVGRSTSKQPKEGTEMKTIAEQITALEATRAAKAARMEEVIRKSIDENRSTNKEEQEEFDTLQEEIEAIDGDLRRLRALEKQMAFKAKPVEGVKDAAAAAESRSEGAVQSVVVRNERAKLPPGIRFARVVRCLGLAQGNRGMAMEIAKDMYKDDEGIANVLKAAVSAGATSSGNWATNLVGDETSIFADFVEWLRPQTIIGRFGTGGIPSLRRVPFRTALVSQTAGGSGYWVGEGKAKPLTSFDFSRTTLDPLKVANIAVLTDEVIRSSSPSAETIVRDSLGNALRERIDLDFVDPDKAAVSGVSPASILNGITAVASTGADADSIRNDIRALFGAFIADNNTPTNGVWIMSSRTALTLSMMVNALGQPEFPGITMNGGTFAGLPVITSEFITPDTSGDFVALVNASDIYIADDGDVAVDMSREASLEMSNTPTQDSVAPTAAQLVSLWQTNSVGFRAERTINWARRRSSAVAWLSGVAWGFMS